ncbi:hypothetical protein [Nereida sp. MMG025]|uniref:hypothetical protein n=1 Tax=Nereida sp. MMG025 TaxID=2909981 RepID=UPI001F44DD6D|nr:hypothetical protein [Nereida sp. MMG025]MCF6446034.1 hypothetical protein [Nereida sp. MMG025]
MRSILFAAALVAAPTFATAQAFDTAGMTAGLSMLETNVAGILDQYNIDADPTSLDLAQIVQIINVVEEDGSRNIRSAIEVIVDGS